MLCYNCIHRPRYPLILPTLLRPVEEAEEVGEGAGLASQLEEEEEGTMRTRTKEVLRT